MRRGRPPMAAFEGCRPHIGLRPGDRWVGRDPEWPYAADPCRERLRIGAEGRGTPIGFGALNPSYALALAAKLIAVALPLERILHQDRIVALGTGAEQRDPRLHKFLDAAHVFDRL